MTAKSCAAQAYPPDPFLSTGLFRRTWGPHQGAYLQSPTTRARLGWDIFGFRGLSTSSSLSRVSLIWSRIASYPLQQDHVGVYLISQTRLVREARLKDSADQIRETSLQEFNRHRAGSLCPCMKGRRSPGCGGPLFLLVHADSVDEAGGDLGTETRSRQTPPNASTSKRLAHACFNAAEALWREL